MEKMRKVPNEQEQDTNQSSKGPPSPGCTASTSSGAAPAATAFSSLEGDEGAEFVATPSVASSCLPPVTFWSSFLSQSVEKRPAATSALGPTWQI